MEVMLYDICIFFKKIMLYLYDLWFMIHDDVSSIIVNILETEMTNIIFVIGLKIDLSYNS